jgi:ElaB/YqjD/DUF883 family membrane-anchored ribosome-binding protein
MERSRENSAENSASHVARTASEAAVTAAQRVGESLDQGRAALADVQAVVSERSRECMQQTDMFVRDNPWQAVGIAAGIGMVLGLLMARR